MTFWSGGAQGSWLLYLSCTCLLLLLLDVQGSGAETIWTANVNYSYVVNNKTVGDEGEIGVFGQDSPLEKVSGLVVLPMKDLDRNMKYSACSSMVNFSLPADWHGPWIALISRGGGCTFNDKINAAAVRGAKAVVIYNNIGPGSNDVIQMSHPGTKDTVAIMIGNMKGEEILQLVVGGQQVTMVIEVGKKHGTWINHYSIFFVSVSFFIVTAATVGYFIFYSARRWRLTRSQDRKMRKLKAEAKAAIGQLQLRTLKQGDKELGPDADSCAVCIDTYKPNDVVRILTCNHFFHKNCIDPWLLDHRTCPMCKCDILKSLGIEADEEEGNTSMAIASVSSELQRSTLHVAEETLGDHASSEFAPAQAADESVEDCGHAAPGYENLQLVNNETSTMAIEVLPHQDNPSFESEEPHARAHELKS